MGYYANGYGTIRFKPEMTSEQKERVDKLIADTWYEFDWAWENCNYKVVELWASDKYYYDTDSLLDKIAEEAPVSEGSIEYSGEDDCYWKFVFDPASNKFVEIDGRVVYDDEVPPGSKVTEFNRAEFVGQIIDVFEDFLDEKGIDISNEDKGQSDNPAILYGMDYGKIQSGIEEIMYSWGIFK